MRKLLIIVYSAFFIIMGINILYYSSLYKKQVNYIEELLNRQVQLFGQSVDNTNNSLISDLGLLSTSGDFPSFFSDLQSQARLKERIKLFFSKYQDLITGIKLFDNNRNEFTLKKDEISNDWLEQPFRLNVQGEIFDEEKLVRVNRIFEYYVPLMKGNIVEGNLVISVDFQRYFSEMFSAFSLKDYQWQWVVNNTGEIIFNNHEGNLRYTRVDRIVENIAGGSIDNIVHEANIDGKLREIISSYYPTHLLQQEMGLVFSARTDFFQKYIIRNSVIIVMSTLMIIQLIILIFTHYLRKQRSDIRKLGSSEELLIKIIEDSPSGIVIRNKNREVLKANKEAAYLYSYNNEVEMKGKVLKESDALDSYNYFSKNLGTAVNSEPFVIMYKDQEEKVLYRSNIPINFLGEEAEMEILTDVTLLEKARKYEAEANAAKSEYLSRISYEIRTPLNDIIGMTDVLDKHNLPGEAKNIVNHIRRSTLVLQAVIKDILDFRRIESGTINLDELPFNLREELGFCMDHVKTTIGGDQIKISCSVDEGVPKSIIGDPLRIRQVLINLLNYSAGNAEKGTIQLKCGLKRYEDGVVTLDFELIYTGNNVDESSLKDSSWEKKDIEFPADIDSNNAGFSSVIAHHLIRMMGGELTVTSLKGLSGDLGKKIKFSIVAYANDNLLKKPDFTEIRNFGMIRTLVITGNNYRDEELVAQLKNIGLIVTVTNFQKSTINQIRTNLNFPDNRYFLIVILNDVKFDGFEATSAIRENGLAEKFILIMVSSTDKKGNYLKSINNGIDHYILKPFTQNVMADILHQCFPYIDKTEGIPAAENIKPDIRILVIEDNRMNQKVIGSMINSLGFTFDIAEDGYEGFLKAKTRRYDLIFMDLVMPGMDGFESARKILDFDKSVLIVAFTADNMPDSKRKAELSGIKEFISKPVRIEELKNLIVKYFSI